MGRRYSALRRLRAAWLACVLACAAGVWGSSSQQGTASPSPSAARRKLATTPLYQAGLSVTSIAASDVVVAFSTRTLVSGWTGPLLTVHSATNVRVDLYASATVKYDLATNASQSVVAWAAANGGSPLYIDKWWDQASAAVPLAVAPLAPPPAPHALVRTSPIQQSGNNKHATAPLGLQPQLQLVQVSGISYSPLSFPWPPDAQRTCRRCRTASTL